MYLLNAVPVRMYLFNAELHRGLDPTLRVRPPRHAEGRRFFQLDGVFLARFTGLIFHVGDLFTFRPDLCA